MRRRALRRRHPMDVLTTARLCLRPFTLDDAAFVLRIVNEPSWLAGIGDRGVHSPDDARAYVENGPLAMYRRFGFGLWVVELLATGAAIGMCGLLRRDGLDDVDLGYALLPEHCGHGYTREAAAAVLQHGARAFGLRRIVAITGPDNHASMKVLVAIGMRRERTLRLPGADRDSLLFAWGEPAAVTPAPGDDREQIDAIARAFFAAFTTKGGARPQLERLTALFHPDARIANATGAEPEVTDLARFVAPRAQLLTDGTLRDFEEVEVAARTELTGRLAQRTCSYRKTGVRGGQPFAATGTKTMLLVRTAAGWRILALAWVDDA